ncbi:MAG: hypothetical protein M0R74_15625 [Dehalococcoidia bacterium]|nr:hypothetical protein [Dehalococcoidia bacterium]
MTIDAEDLPKGCFVFTADGDELGQVQEVHGEYFSVGTGESDTWFHQDVTGELNAGRLVLNLETNEIDASSVMPPPLHH